MDTTSLTAALLPTAALIALGWLLRNRWHFTDTFWPGLERLTYFFLLPSLFVSGLARADFGGVNLGAMALVLASSSVLAAFLTWALRRVITADGPAFTSVFQGGIRFNNYIGLVVATALYGADGLVLAALCNAILVPIVNVTSTITLARHGGGQARGYAVAREVATNPLVVACVVGAGLNLLGHSPVGSFATTTPVLSHALVGLGEFVRILGTAALPIGLLCVGAGLRRPEGSARTTSLIAWSMGLRFVTVPAMTYGIALAAGLTGPAATVALLFQSIPTASSAYMLARRLGGDAPLMAAIIAAQTVAGLATIPIWLVLAQTL
ncbi:MAG: AEC family transporter [Dermatophilus congolensis]|nr:AEC family transporter [Dermatophilus congolensis]